MATNNLQLICDTYIENLIKTEVPKTLGDYIEQVEHRNNNLKYGVDHVRGVSNNKEFIPTKAIKPLCPVLMKGVVETFTTEMIAC